MEMTQHIEKWYSPALGVEMPIVQYGTSGAALLFFPTAAADYLEYERFGLMESIERYVDSGMVTLFSIDSINKRGWLNEDVEPAERARLQVAYDQYVRHEVVPFIQSRTDTTHQGIVTTGASFGAYHAMNEFLKHPDVFGGVIAMSGCFDIRTSCDGYHDDNVYYNNPIEFIPNLTDESILSQMRSAQITILTGKGAYEAPENSREMASILEERKIPCSLDEWGDDVDHDWPWWKAMLQHYIPLYFG